METSESEVVDPDKEPRTYSYIMNIVASQIGLGVLTIPYIFKDNGIIITLIIFICVTTLVLIPIKMIDQMAEEFNIKGQKMSTLYRAIFGQWGKNICTFLIISAQISYYIIRILLCCKLKRAICGIVVVQK